MDTDKWWKLVWKALGDDGKDAEEYVEVLVPPIVVAEPFVVAVDVPVDVVGV